MYSKIFGAAVAALVLCTSAVSAATYRQVLDVNRNDLAASGSCRTNTGDNQTRCSASDTEQHRLSFQTFDTSLGTLNGVTLSWEMDIEYRIAVEVGFFTDTFDGKVSATLALRRGNDRNALQTVTSSKTLSNNAWEITDVGTGVLNMSGSASLDPTTYLPGASSDLQEVNLAFTLKGEVLDKFICGFGQAFCKTSFGTDSITSDLYPFGSVLGPRNSGFVMVTFDYTPFPEEPETNVVPLPAAGWLLLAGLGGIGLLRRST